MLDDECPGCQDCGDKCDVYQGEHLWVKLHKTEYQSLVIFNLCDFCGKKVFLND